MIPKIIHQIWLGDQSLRPAKLMSTWPTNNPSWEYKIWTDDNLPTIINRDHFESYGDNQVGKANILRYEILKQFGGFYVDADSKSLEPLDDTLLTCNAFACWENEIVKKGVISNGYLASVKDGYTVNRLVAEINAFDNVLIRRISPWRITGIKLLSNLYNMDKNVRDELKVYPSHYFIPTHHTGHKYHGPDKIYSEQYWGNTLQKYNELTEYE